MSADRTYTPQEIETLIERARYSGWREGVAEGEAMARKAVVEFALSEQERIKSDNVVAQEYCEFACRVLTEFARAIERGEWR